MVDTKKGKKRAGKRKRLEKKVELAKADANGVVTVAPKPKVSALVVGTVEHDIGREEKSIVLLDPAENGSKKRKKEQRRKALVANKLWRSFDRKSQTANKYFSEYYRKQLGIDNDKDWEAFLNILAKNLLVTFRLNRGRFPFIAKSFEKRLTTDFSFSGSFVRVGVDKILSSSEILNPLAGFSDVYKLGTDRAGFSKATALETLYDTIDREAKLGHLARQGIASMLPAIVLHPKPHEFILDMCAAPGSKTEQLLQMMGPDAEGVVVCNDSDPKRLESVRRRFQCVPGRNLVVTNSRGEDLYKYMGSEKFDGVICDVPCSGDGTIRKYPYLWRRWRAKRGVLLHPLQLQLAMSAASLLKVGGRLIYSTCSINPIEDEAVVAALLKASKGALRLVPVDLKSFKVRKGLYTWDDDEVLMKEGAEDADEDEDEVVLGEDENNGEQEKSTRTKKRRKISSSEAKRKGAFTDNIKLTESMRPPSAKEAAEWRLEECIRVLHHDNDTEGFFLALIEKVSPWEMSDQNEKSSSGVSAKSAKNVLKDVGFNPRLAADLGPKDMRWFSCNDSLVKPAVSQIKGSFGCPEELLESRQILFQTGKGQVSAQLLSPGAASLISEKWALEGSIPIFMAGALFAKASCDLNREKVPAAVNQFTPISAGSLEYVSQLQIDDLDSSAALCTVSPVEMFSLLQMSMQAIRSQEQEKESTKTEAPVYITMRSCIETLEGESMEEDDEEEKEGKALDPDLCQHPASQIILEAPIGSPIYFSVPNSALFEFAASFEADEIEQKQVKEQPKKKLSAAERRRMKKNKKKGGNDNTETTQSKDTSTSPKDVDPENFVNMFGKTKQPSTEIVLVLQKLSNTAIQIISDFEQVTSFGQAFQAFIPSSQEDSDDEDHENEMNDLEDE